MVSKEVQLGISCGRENGNGAACDLSGAGTCGTYETYRSHKSYFGFFLVPNRL
jgi:hypothetical protein